MPWSTLPIASGKLSCVATGSSSEVFSIGELYIYVASIVTMKITQPQVMSVAIYVRQWLEVRIRTPSLGG